MNFKSVITIFCFAVLLGCNAEFQTPVSNENATLELTRLDGTPIPSPAMDEFLLSKMEELQIPGLSVAVISKGDISYLRSFGVVRADTAEPVGPETVFEAASISKAVFAYFVMTMVEDGTLDLDRPMHEYLPLPELEHDERYRSITARMALSHQTGLPNWRFLEEDGKLDIKFDPGTEFGYSGEAYEYLVAVVAHLNGVTPRTLEDVFQERVAVPLEMTHSSFTRNAHWDAHKAYGHEAGVAEEDRWYTDLSVFGGAHSLHSNAEDLAKFALAVIEGRGLEPDTYAEMLSEQVVLPDDQPIRTSFGIESWALGFGRSSTEAGMKYAHGGVNEHANAYFMVIPAQGYGVVFFANSSNGLALAEELEGFLGVLAGSSERSEG
ncbi:serine hydrolase domain-containing protein [Alkalisalibacterium limincola]|uniref:Beta-lactamase family protein n=1 Tax=Alkalisalibacterium limincola TaxID=2699169 RepID=A0A5C8KYT9_9GAMM|nr:serine hydrolase domain-containing protein [Alkalisalibacterium limincola]TXK64527.1 beta-lactamase family protein [Alkalisalibacterium limincola]